MSKLKVIQTSDIHSYMFIDDYVKKGQIKEQGLLRFYDYINQQKEHYEVLLIDSGDMFQGSPLSFYVSDNIKNYPMHPITEALNYMKYDVVTLGNHEFNYGFDYLNRCFDNLDAQVVLANVENIDEYLNVKPYVIKKIGNLKVAIIGFVTAAITNFEKKENIKNLKFLSIIDTYAKYEKQLKEQADVIIVNYHGGFEESITNETLDNIAYVKSIENEGIEFLKKFTSVDIFLTGHQHLELCEKINNTQIMQPGANGSKISEVTIENGEISGELVNVFNNTVPNINNLIKLENEVQNYLDVPIGQSSENLEITDLFLARLNSHPLVNFINEVQIDCAGADISAMSLFDNAIGFKKDITMRQILANYPFPNEVVMLEITKEDLKQALEISASYFVLDGKQIKVSTKFSKPKLQNYQYDMFYGFTYEIDITKSIGNRITKLELPSNIDHSKIKIALNSYRASNYAWYPMYEDKKILYKSPTDMISILVDYIKDKKVINVHKEKTFVVKH